MMKIKKNWCLLPLNKFTSVFFFCRFCWFLCIRWCELCPLEPIWKVKSEDIPNLQWRSNNSIVEVYWVMNSFLICVVFKNTRCLQNTHHHKEKMEKKKRTNVLQQQIIQIEKQQKQFISDIIDGCALETVFNINSRENHRFFQLWSILCKCGVSTSFLRTWDRPQALSSLGCDRSFFSLYWRLWISTKHKKDKNTFIGQRKARTSHTFLLGAARRNPSLRMSMTVRLFDSEFWKVSGPVTRAGLLTAKPKRLMASAW